jgi:AmmeMemoRadiSam system protein B
MVREPAVAGKFYPANPATLRADVNSYLSPARERVAAIGCIAPHAGYMYSGQVAGAVFSAMAEGRWWTPLGEVAIDSELAARLLQSYSALTDDSAAHQFEHAIEVELPFLQTVRSGVQIVPIAVGTGRLLLLDRLGQALAAAVQLSAEPVLIVASSDMNHYEDDASTRVKDRKAIDKILALDPQGLYDTVMAESISMCGFGPAVAMLTAAKLLGANKAELVQYATSGDVSGDKDMVVGYAGIVVS